MFYVLVKECPEYDDKVCNDNGLCNRTVGICTCNSTYYGEDCSSKLQHLNTF